MTDEQLGKLFESFANFYWSVPVSFVMDKLHDWHPNVAAPQIDRVLKRCTENIFRYHCCVETEGLDEPELVAEHLIALDDNAFESFMAARIDGPFFDCDEQELLTARTELPYIPELNAILAFGRTELGLDDEWNTQLADDCIFLQPCALCDKESWVMRVLENEQYGKIHFRTVDQVRRFRELGNRFYLVMPNPVLRGWPPAEIEHPPVLSDDIPERDEDIPDGRPAMDAIFAPYGGREKFREMLMRNSQHSAVIKKQKIGRNAPCPCGSGLKFKKCTCPEYHPE